MKRLTLILATMLCNFTGCAQEEASNGTTIPDAEIVAEKLAVPWDIAFLPDQSILFTERGGRVGHIEGKTVSTVGQLEVADVGEAGLLGLAIDPDFSGNRRIYLYYTYSHGGSMYNRVSRFEYRDTLGGETVLIDSIPGATIHDGGRLEFGPDGYLYATTGDASVPSRSADTASLNGKILRLTTEGSVPPGNPFGNFVFAKGLRNCEGIAWTGDGQLYATDHGPTRHDEVNLIEAGEDYGWPVTCTDQTAFKCYRDFTLAPADITVAGDYLLVTGLRGNQIRRINLESGAEDVFFSDKGRIRPITEHDGFIYFGTSNRDGRGDPRENDDKIYRISGDVFTRKEPASAGLRLP